MARAKARHLPVSQWLAVAAASVGAGAALAVLGPQVGVAAADATGETSVSSSTSAGPATPAAQRRAKLAEARETRKARAEARTAQRRQRLSTAATDESTEDTVTPRRRTLVNRAPKVTPEQLTGVIDGPITGTVGAVDPDGDPMQYRVIRTPRSGSVALDDDGGFTYTPGTGFNGVDTFRVIAIDTASQPKLLRPVGTRATALINQGAIEFVFTYAEGAQYWTPERRAALEAAADDVASYFRVKKPVTLTYSVTAKDDPDSDTLASAGSDYVVQWPGFWPLVVQRKLQTGWDSNGKAPDGEIEWNFGYEWALGDTVGDDEYDFAATAAHEFLHSFGFLSGLQAPGDNAAEPVWTLYDRFVRTADGRNPFAGHRWLTRYDPNLTGGDGGLYFGGSHAIAAYGSLVPLFTPNPWEEGSSMSHLDDYTFTGSDQQMMNATTGTGPGVRTIGAIELGILTDIGYHVYPPVQAMALIGVVFLRRRRPLSR
jgi:hypothetical protein